MEDINITKEDIERVEAVCNGTTLLLMTVGAVTISIGAIKIGRGIGKLMLRRHDRKVRKELTMDQTVAKMGL